MSKHFVKNGWETMHEGSYALPIQGPICRHDFDMSDPAGQDHEPIYFCALPLPLLQRCGRAQQVWRIELRIVRYVPLSPFQHLPHLFKLFLRTWEYGSTWVEPDDLGSPPIGCFAIPGENKMKHLLAMSL